MSFENLKVWFPGIAMTPKNMPKLIELAIKSLPDYAQFQVAAACMGLPDNLLIPSHMRAALFRTGVRNFEPTDWAVTWINAYAEAVRDYMRAMRAADTALIEITGASLMPVYFK